jgi:hypothetical protein
MRKSLVGGSFALVLLVAAACQPTKPPPPPPPPTNTDVLVLGDSVGFGVGCMLGDNGPDNQSCPPKPGFSTINGYLGACAVAEGAILLYNHTAVEGNCNVAGADATTLWPQAVSALDPELVVIVTGGWEIVDRWSSLPGGCAPENVTSCSQADIQFAGVGAFNTAAINNYKAEMTNVIAAIRATAPAPKVLLLNSPYVAPATPDVSNVWWEAYPQSQPFGWIRPNQNTPYKSSENKIDVFNTAVAQVAAGFGTDVEMFDFWVEFSPVINGDQEFSFDLCPYPNNKVNPASCPGGAQPFTARLSDAGHLTTAGNDMLGQAMLSTVYEMLGILEP